MGQSDPSGQHQTGVERPIDGHSISVPRIAVHVGFELKSALPRSVSSMSGLPPRADIRAAALLVSKVPGAVIAFSCSPMRISGRGAGGRVVVLDTDYMGRQHTDNEASHGAVLSAWNEHFVHAGLPRTLSRQLRDAAGAEPPLVEH